MSHSDQHTKAALQMVQEGRDSLLKQGLRDRPGQLQMAEAVARALSSTGRTLACEGPTGTGKGLAYLLGGIAAARSTKRQLVVSTATIALQEQLVQKDLVLLNEHTGWKVKYALAKGRLRYVCDRRLEDLSADASESAGDLFDVPPDEASRAVAREMKAARAAKRWSGDLDEWPAGVSAHTQAAVTVPGSSCSGSRCPFFRNCALFAAREKVRKAEVVVANAALVLADIATGGGNVLPEPASSLYIFDEAHHLPDVARQQFTVTVQVAQARRVLRKLTGQLSSCAAALKALEPTVAPADIESAAAALDGLLEGVSLALLRQAEREEPTLVIGAQFGLRESMAAIKTEAATLDRLLGRIMEAARQGEDQGAGDVVIRSLGPATAVAEQLARLSRLWCYAPNPDPIARWFTPRVKDGEVLLSAATVDASSLLRKRLWSVAAGSVLTSATLRSLGRFDALQRGCGLPSGFDELALPSPFDLARQGEVLVPRVCSPKQVDAHTQALIQQLPAFLDSAKGSLTLFASYRQMKAVVEGLPPRLGKRVLMQGTGAREALLKKHRSRIAAGESSMLFGVQSFGEGLDLPGEECSLVVVAKLPFPIPSSPVERARANWLKARGQNPFAADVMPRAHRTLVQWCGRLVRSEADRGRIVIFDSRLLDSDWGRQMLDTLPPFRRETVMVGRPNAA